MVVLFPSRCCCASVHAAPAAVVQPLVDPAYMCVLPVLCVLPAAKPALDAALSALNSITPKVRSG